MNFLRKKSKFQINQAWKSINSIKIDLRFLYWIIFHGEIFFCKIFTLLTFLSVLEKYQAYVTELANVTEQKILLEATVHWECRPTVYKET